MFPTKMRFSISISKDVFGNHASPTTRTTVAQKYKSIYSTTVAQKYKTASTTPPNPESTAANPLVDE